MQGETEQVDIFQKYSEEFTADTSLDELNIKERAMTVVAIKHKWVGRLMRHKMDLKKLENAKKTAINKISTKLTTNTVELTTTAAKKAALGSDIVERIIIEIDKTTLIIEYLEKVERILNSMTYDIKNLIEIQKLECM
jgi:hypothetical protein